MNTWQRFSQATRKSLVMMSGACAACAFAYATFGSGLASLVIALIALFLTMFVFLGHFAGSVEGWFRRVPPSPSFLDLDPRISLLGERKSLTNKDYDSLVGYFAVGIRDYRSPGCALVLYPGLPGTQGLRTEEMVGFTRSAPLLAAWVHTRGDIIPLDEGETFNAFNHLISGLQAGTDPNSPEYWGPATDFSQRIVEAADVALIAWMLRDRLQETLSKNQQALLTEWLGTVAGRKIYDGNWNLFPLIVGLSLESWGVPFSREIINEHYSEFKKAYRGGGWFGDGVGGRVDYYNVWQMQYFLYFATQMSSQIDNTFIHDVLIRFAEDYQYFFTPQGFPIFGRSVGYRMAVPTPLVLTSSLPDSPITPSLARRALDTTWSYFIGQGALRNGTVTQGYTVAQPEIMENYGGRGCCLWALRSLTAAYYLPPTAPIWTKPAEKLPVEKSSYDRHIAAAGLHVIGDHITQTVEVRPDGNESATDMPLQRLGPLRKLGQIVFRRALRPDNFDAKYKRAVYRSNKPFCS